MSSVFITTNFVSTNPAHGEVYSNTTLCDKVCQSLVAGQWFIRVLRFPPPIIEILLKVALNTIPPYTGITRRWTLSNQQARNLLIIHAFSCSWSVQCTLSSLGDIFSRGR
jgi:hypothetical protein